MLSFVSKQPLGKGWSGDKKYVAADEKGNKFLLKISPPERQQGRQQLFAILKRLESMGVSMYRPVEQFSCPEGFCTVYEWVEGRDAREAVPLMTGQQQYAHGVHAGEMLRLIHSVPPPEDLPKWEEHFNAKIDRKIKMALDCREEMPGRELMIDFVNEHRYLLEGRPVTFQHGDYHEGNMLIDNSGRLVVIDFEGADFGDPWEEFNRIVWTAQLAPDMARGTLDGYFGGTIPDEFWPLLALYLLTTQLSSVPWAISFGADEVRKFQRQAREVMDWYKGMTRLVPTWYE